MKDQSNVAGDIKIVDADGNISKAMDIYIGDIFKLLNKIPQEELEKTCCLGFIDPWGDTIFNEMQIRILIKEFKDLSNKCETEEEKQTIRSIIEFISEALGDYNFVRFYGD